MPVREDSAPSEKIATIRDANGSRAPRPRTNVATTTQQPASMRWSRPRRLLFMLACASLCWIIVVTIGLILIRIG